MILRSHNHSWCKTCVPTSSALARMQRYNVSQPEFDAQLARQNYVCAICEAPSPDALDHDHATGKFRGVICKACNCALAVLENKNLLPRAEAYLHRHSSS